MVVGDYMSGSFNLEEKNFENLVHLHLDEILLVAGGRNAHDIFSISEKKRLTRSNILRYSNSVKNLIVTTKTREYLASLGYNIE